MDADGCFWQRLLYYDGSRGHCFTLTREGGGHKDRGADGGRGASNPRPRARGAGESSSLAVDGGIVPPSTSLVFDAPGEYLQRMEALRAQMEVDPISSTCRHRS